MHVLQIEHPIRELDTWKMALDPVDGRRQQLGVRVLATEFSNLPTIGITS